MLVTTGGPEHLGFACGKPSVRGKPNQDAVTAWRWRLSRPPTRFHPETMMPALASFPEIIAQACALSERCLQADAAEDCGALDQAIRRVDDLAREAIHQRLASDLLRIADKLDSGAALSPDDERNLETFAIGNAARYVSAENNVEEWKAEVRRLIAELDDVASIAESSVDRLLHVRALCRDAMGVLPELIHWMEEKERIERFRAGAVSRDPERGRIIARFLRESLRPEAP
jgi:hypothetical protein